LEFPKPAQKFKFHDIICYVARQVSCNVKQQDKFINREK
jgi:hypothetical protein